MAQRRNLKLITAPASEPVTLDQAKNHQRIDLTDDDSLFTSLIKVARQKAEEYTRRAFITQTWELSLDGATGVMELPRQPIQSIITITLDGVALSTDDYQTDISGSRVRFLSPQKANHLGGVKIRYVAGYGPDATNVPELIKEAILQMVGHFYEYRESQAMPMLARELLSPYKVWSL